MEINLIVNPEDTFLYDHLNMKEVDDLLDSIKVFNELTVGIKYDDFLSERHLSQFFAPTATFHQEDAD